MVQIMRVFLSYSHADKDFAGQLASHLSEQGCDVWDPSDQLYPGDNWPLKIGEALKESKAMVVLLSPDSMKSEWVRGEIQYAIGDRNYEGRVIPVLVRPTEKIPAIFRQFNILRANNDPAQVSVRIARALGQATVSELSKAVPLEQIELERRTIEQALASSGGDKSLAARKLGIGKTSLYRKLKQYQLTQ